MVSQQTTKAMGGNSQMKKFYISFLVEVDDDNNILSSYEQDHIEDVYDLMKNILHDVDDVQVENLNVKERPC